MDKIFKALADQNRRKILSIIKEQEMGVSEILSNFQITQATLSSHLAILRKAKLVECKVKGRERIYFINRDLFSRFVEELVKFVSNKEDFRPIDEIKIRGGR